MIPKCIGYGVKRCENEVPALPKSRYAYALYCPDCAARMNGDGNRAAS